MEKLIKTHSDISRLVKTGQLIICIAFFGIGSWAICAPLSGAIIASGIVKVDNNRKTVQHLEGGIVKEILVSNGDKVKQGQPLIVIADAKVSATVELLQSELDSELAKESRLTAEREFKPLSFSADVLHRANNSNMAKIIKAETQLFNSRRDSMNSQIFLLKRQIEQLKEEIAGISEQIKSEELAINYMKEDLRSNETLLEKKFIQKSRLLTLQRDLADHQALRFEHVADLSRARQKSMDLELRIINIRSEYMQQAAHDFEETTKRVREIQEKLTPALDAVKRQQILSPVEGEVVGLAVHTIGGVIASKEPLMDLIPTNGKLIIELKLGVDDIDETQLGANADIHFSAYPQRNTPLITGRVSYIAADRSQDEQSKIPYYIVQVQVDSDSLRKAKSISLTPGMTADVYIKTRKRTALQYLIEPITNTLRHSLRES